MGDVSRSKDLSCWPFFSYYGGKWRIAKRYPPPEFGHIIEPFAGAAGYATRYPDADVTLYDANPIIVGMWDYLIHVSRADVLRLPIGIEHVDDLGRVPQEAKWLVGWWFNKGTATPHYTPSTWMRSGVRPKSYWGEEIRERIARQVDRIRHWTVALADYSEIPITDSATWFVDPPYIGLDGTHYAAKVTDYLALGAWCRALPGQVIVCEQAGANWLPFTPFHTAKNSPGRGAASTVKEVIWTNATPQHEGFWQYTGDEQGDEWECADGCPHPSHEIEAPHR